MKPNPAHHVVLLLLLLLLNCTEVLCQDAAPYNFDGITLNSTEDELPGTYKALFDARDCRPDKLGKLPVKQCAREFPPNSLPARRLDVKNQIQFYLNYVGGRLGQIGFQFPRNDYASVVAVLTKEHGTPLFAKKVVMDAITETEYTWNWGNFSIATYPFYRNSQTSCVFYSVIREAR